MKVQFAGQDIEVKDLLAKCIAANYLQFGFADGGEADKVAERIMSVLDDVGCKIVRVSVTEAKPIVVVD